MYQIVRIACINVIDNGEISHFELNPEGKIRIDFCFISARPVGRENVAAILFLSFSSSEIYMVSFELPLHFGVFI